MVRVLASVVTTGLFVVCLALAGCESSPESPVIKPQPQTVVEPACMKVPVIKTEARPIVTRGGNPGTCLTQSAVLAEPWPVGCGNADLRPRIRDGVVEPLPLALAGRSGRVDRVVLYDSCGGFAYDLPPTIRKCLEREFAQWTFVPDGKGCPPVYYEEEQVGELTPTNEWSSLGGGSQ